MKHHNLVGLALIVAAIAAGSWWAHLRAGREPQKTQNGASSQTVQPSGSSQPSFNKKLYSIDDPASIWVVVNKARPLNPISYIPKDLATPSVPLRVPGNESMQLRKEAATALEALVLGAKAGGLGVMLSSGYRSYAYQAGLYGSYVASQGKAAADTQSARPGHSEHQTGLAADLEPTSRNCEVSDCFANTPEGKWLAANAYKYGFIVRYQEGTQPIVGYKYEPWHLRYIGTALSQEMHGENVNTLEQFFGLPAAPGYSS
jgi:D-alanyl-D-alanine carboxypeptidase